MLASTVAPITSTAVGMELAKGAADAGAATIAHLTSALARGDEQAFRDFHAAYCDRLFRYLVVVTRGDEQAAREALQETFTRVARYVRRFESEEIFWDWLATLARSAATDGSRRRTSYWRALKTYALSLWPVQPESAPDVDERLRELLDIAIDSLPDDDRVLIRAKYHRGETVERIAAEHCLSAKAVESRLVRARRELRVRVNRMLKDEESA